jgi:apoptosis-inducing factor 2
MKRVVVIGGGFVGSHVAKSLEQEFHVTLIDTKDYFEFTPSVLRTIVEPGHMKKVQVLHSHYLKKATLIREEVKKITDTDVLLKKKKVPYDYLVLALGSDYQSHIKEKNVLMAARAHILREAHRDLDKAGHVVIIGGGLVGIELAAEVVEHYQDRKKVTIIHSRHELIPRNNPKARAYAKRFFQNHKVNLVLGERLKDIHGKILVTEKGRKIEAEMFFMCVGITPNTGLMKASFPDSLTERGTIHVNEQLQVKGLPNVYSAGDVSGIKEEKTAQNAEKAANIIVKNIRLMASGEPLEKYEGKSRVMIISLGKKKGILTYKGYTMTGRIPGLLKTLVEWKSMIKYR